MGASKRKRQSMDSAIADMSAGDLSGTQTSNTAQEESASSRQRKRRNSSCLTASSGFAASDFGTPASLRPHRDEASQGSDLLARDELCQRHKRSTRVVNNYSVAPEVKEDSVERETPEREQTALELPTPPQILKMSKTQSISQVSLCRPSRKRRLTEPPPEEAALCKKKPKASAVGLAERQCEVAAATQDRKSCIVRLRVPAFIARESSQLMTISESFSYPQKSSDAHEQISQTQHQNFAENDIFLDHNPETFAQPQPEPILADSQDLNSSQSAPVNTTSHAAAILREHLQTGCSLTRERFSAPSWTFRQDDETPSGLDLEPSPQQDDSSMEQNNTAVNDSWQTQPTQPWCPPWNADSPVATQQAPESASFHASQATTIDEAPIHLPSVHQTLSSQRLYEIADRLFAHRTSGPPKPEPVGRPSVWADTRMDLCETLHYFRSYQSACHSTGGFVRGFMFDKVAHARDYIDSNVVIARAGGGQVRDREFGELKAFGDQIEGTVSQKLRNCMGHYNPVVIIAGIDNPHMPSQPPHQYCVLDYFKPTHIWTEKSGSSKIVRYRFEKLNARRDSWWRPKDVEDPVKLGVLPPPFSKACGTCARESLQIYLNGWMCLHPTCGSFWLIFPSGTEYLRGSDPFEPDEASLIYDPRFLKSQTPWPNDSHTYPLTSTDATTSIHAVPGEDTSEAFTRGTVCPRCGRCTSRLSWTGWECPCGWTKRPSRTLIPALSIREPLWPLSDAYAPSRDTHSPLVRVYVDFAHGYRIHTYMLPGIDGFVTHMIANARVVAEPGGPDDMFEELQRTDIGLRRRPMESSMVKGGMYTRHFCVNYGEPYKSIAATETHPFPSSPHPITAARSRLDWAARLILSRTPQSFPPSSPSHLTEYESHPFNEVLALAYFESQRISYHDDGEPAVGPTICTLSLGATGTMRIRLKPVHHRGVSSSGLYNDAAPIPGATAYAARLALVEPLRRLKARGSPALYHERLREIPHELGLRSSGNAREAVVLKLGHGDVVAMHGDGVQRCYEHAVEHAGKLRFAVTGRYVAPEGDEREGGAETSSKGAC